jgi:hypothetical protein
LREFWRDFEFGPVGGSALLRSHSLLLECRSDRAKMARSSCNDRKYLGGGSKRLVRLLAADLRSESCFAGTWRGSTLGTFFNIFHCHGKEMVNEGGCLSLGRFIIYL